MRHLSTNHSPSRAITDGPATLFSSKLKSSLLQTGMDFARLFLLKRGHTRKPVIIKAYLCIFVCLRPILRAFPTCPLRRSWQPSSGSLPDVAFHQNCSATTGLTLKVPTMKEFYRFLSCDATQQSIHHHLLNNRVKLTFSPE